MTNLNPKNWTSSMEQSFRKGEMMKVTPIETKHYRRRWYERAADRLIRGLFDKTY